MIRRAVAEPGTPQDVLVDRLRADMEEMAKRHEMELAAANARADRAEHVAKRARDAVFDTAAEVADLNANALPALADYHPGFDEPIPDDTRITKRGDWQVGTWPPVRGDLGDHYGQVEAVDFGPLYALIGTTELAGVSA